MTTEGFKRKLTAILSADVEGYSRLMGEDEDATIRTLTAYRELMSTLIQKQRGRVIDSPGDNLLAEFLSVVDAVRCAVEIQEELRVRNAELPDNRKMEFRIGINLGDVVEEGGRIYGDGVNITARVEGLAEGGGICISGTVYDSIKNKLTLGYESLGENTVKNIKEPVRVYRMRVGPDAAALGESKKKRPKMKIWQWAAMTAMVVLILGVVLVWNFYFRLPSIEPASVEKMAFSLPDKPSIAVLPFDNLSGDAQQGYFSDGLAEEITTSLSKVPDLFVIARNSSFTYKGKAVKVQQVAEDLGVQYVLEGSVRKEENKVRITAQLIDAITGKHLWADRYDRELKDIFALQDEITMKVLTALQVKLTEGDKAHILAKGTNNLEAYLKSLKAREIWMRFTEEGNRQTQQIYMEVIALDPKWSLGYNGLGWALWVDVVFRWSKSPEASLARAEEMARKALELDDTLGFPHGLLAKIFLVKKQYDKAIAEHELAVSKIHAPGDISSFAATLLTAGRPEESIPLFKKAIRLDPIGRTYRRANLGRAYFSIGRYEDALSEFNIVLEKGDYNPSGLYSGLPHRCLAATYAMLGRDKEARKHAEALLKVNPNFTLERWEKYLNSHSANKTADDLEINALRRAGLK